MLTIKCAASKTKIMKYKKIGKGQVLKCWESKIQKFYRGAVKRNQLICEECGTVIGDIKEYKQEPYVKMNAETFTFTGTKIK